jgi:hypothetical protein
MSSYINDEDLYEAQRYLRRQMIASYENKNPIFRPNLPEAVWVKAVELMNKTQRDRYIQLSNADTLGLTKAELKGWKVVCTRIMTYGPAFPLSYKDVANSGTSERTATTLFKKLQESGAFKKDEGWWSKNKASRRSTRFTLVGLEHLRNLPHITTSSLYTTKTLLPAETYDFKVPTEYREIIGDSIDGSTQNQSLARFFMQSPSVPYRHLERQEKANITRMLKKKLAERELTHLYSRLEFFNTYLERNTSIAVISYSPDELLILNQIKMELDEMARELKIGDYRELTQEEQEEELKREQLQRQVEEHLAKLMEDI